MTTVFDVCIREAQDAEILLAQEDVALDIVEAGVMRRAVRFDDQTVTQAGEIGDVTADDDLPPELQAVQPPA